MVAAALRHGAGGRTLTLALGLISAEAVMVSCSSPPALSDPKGLDASPSSRGLVCIASLNVRGRRARRGCPPPASRTALFRPARQERPGPRRVCDCLERAALGAFRRVAGSDR